MNNERKMHYILTICLIIVLRLSDLGVTYLYTRDLAYEWNPLVSQLGAGWTTMLIIQSLIVAFITVLAYFYFSREELRIETPGLSFNEFIYVYFFGKLHPIKERAFHLPTDYKRVLAHNGFVFTVVAIVISLFAVINNLLIVNRIAVYEQFVLRYQSVYFPLVMMGVALLTINWFFVIEYRRYRKQ